MVLMCSCLRSVFYLPGNVSSCRASKAPQLYTLANQGQYTGIHTLNMLRSARRVTGLMTRCPQIWHLAFENWRKQEVSLTFSSPFVLEAGHKTQVGQPRTFSLEAPHVTAVLLYTRGKECHRDIRKNLNRQVLLRSSVYYHQITHV